MINASYWWSMLPIGILYNVTYQCWWSMLPIGILYNVTYQCFLLVYYTM